MKQKGSNGQRLNSIENNIKDMQKKLSTLQEDYKEHLETHIKDDLCQERFIGSGKPLYSYQDIANRYGVSTSKVQRVAENNGLTRRNKDFS